MSGRNLTGWERLKHSGLLLDPQRLSVVAAYEPEPLAGYLERDLRKQTSAMLDGAAEVPAFVYSVLTRVCGFDGNSGKWLRGPQVPTEWNRTALTGETVKPRQLWVGANQSVLPVFIDKEKRVGIGRGRKAVSLVLQWLRDGDQKLALLTNGRQWRLVFAGLDFDAWCEWDAELWFEEGELSPQVTALRTLVQPDLWLKEDQDGPSPLLDAIQSSRKGQAELSKVLGERVREAVEVLVSGHGEALKGNCADVESADIYRAAVRVVMRMVVTLFAESRELLPRDNALYHGSYGLSGLLEELEKSAARGRSRLKSGISAWPRILALFRLIHQGSHHPDLPVPAYGGELFGPGSPESPDGMSRALAVFETTCFDQQHPALSDADVYTILEHITRTKVKVRQGRASTWVPAPVDFSDLSSEYIGILYEGLLDFELKTAPEEDPVVFLAVGDQPALPLSRLESMDDKALKDLLEKMKDTSKDDVEEAEEEEAPDEESSAESAEDESDDEEGDEVPAEDEATGEDLRQTVRMRAESWARRAVEIGKLAKKPRGTMTPEKQAAYDEAVARKARQIVVRAVLPGEWYLARWGGTRKGSGTFYTRPGLAVPTVHRTLRPLLYEESQGTEDARPKLPEQLLELKIVDPACGSGTFPVAALRYVTDALYASLLTHGRISEEGDRSMVALLKGKGGDERLQEEMLPCLKDDEQFEPRLKAVLRRHVVERCIYGVDLDPIAVELCRLALWVETMDRSLPFSFLDHKIKCGNGLVGAWMDQFEHYPIMAWDRVAGDEKHDRFVHHFHEKTVTRGKNAGKTSQSGDSWTQAVKDQKAKVKADLIDWLSGQMKTGEAGDPSAVAKRLKDFRDVLNGIHSLPPHDSAARKAAYAEVVGGEDYNELKTRLDLWCSLWFWPPDRCSAAPLPSTFAAPGSEAVSVSRQVAASWRFFHWELEFPDVYTGSGSGFDGVLGNPPWDIAKPSSKEFFSAHDPLYRGYGKQDALDAQVQYFKQSAVFEERWIKYQDGFKAQSNWAKYAGFPFGDRVTEGSDGNPIHDFGLGTGGAQSRRHSEQRHALWKKRRGKVAGFADLEHPFRHQGSADINLYKLFLEQAHALLCPSGRMGFIVPSGLYSDRGTGALRTLFLEQCQWEWIFGFENREKVFDIDSRFKFTPIIVQKGGTTRAIRTAFMRRRLEDWERGEAFATPYALERVERFSPKSKAILEIQSARDLEILEKIYSNSVLLGDDGPDGWGIKYRCEFHMTNDSKLFPPRPKWEAKGYRPDEYSRWLLGDWRPIDALWKEMGVDPRQPKPLDPECEKLVQESDVVNGDHPVRCAQPPYDRIPVPRADIPKGIILSREVDAFIWEDDIEGTALPLYEGRMIGHFDYSQKGWVSGKGRSAVWRDIPWVEKRIEPQYLIGEDSYRESVLSSYLKEIGKSEGAGARKKIEKRLRDDPLALAIWWMDQWNRVGFIDVTSATNNRTTFASLIAGSPCGNSAPVLRTSRSCGGLAAVLNSLVYDNVARFRCGGLHLNWFVIEESPLPMLNFADVEPLRKVGVRLGAVGVNHAVEWSAAMADRAVPWRKTWAVTGAERLRLRAKLDAAVALAFGLRRTDIDHVLRGTDLPRGKVDSYGAGDPKGFWRVDKPKDAELRLTTLTRVAFEALMIQVDDNEGITAKAIEDFLDDEGSPEWELPERLRLKDFGLGHDQRAEQPQPVAKQLGPRFADWQLAQTASESWRECDLHCRNILGKDGIDALRQREGGAVGDSVVEYGLEDSGDPQKKLF